MKRRSDIGLDVPDENSPSSVPSTSIASSSSVGGAAATTTTAMAAATNAEVVSNPPPGKRRKRANNVLVDSRNVWKPEVVPEVEVDLLDEMGVSPLGIKSLVTEQQPELIPIAPSSTSSSNAKTSFSSEMCVFWRTPRIPLKELIDPPPVLSKKSSSLSSSSSSSVVSRGPDYFSKLSDEIIVNIFKWLSKSTLAKCALVSKRWRRVSYDDSLWKRVNLMIKSLPPGVIEQVLSRGAVIVKLARSHIISPALKNSSSSKILCKLQYLDLSMATVEVSCLQKILNSCRSLKKLSLEHCVVSDEVCSEIGLNPDLTVLHLGMARELTAVGLASILRGCPNLEELNVSWTDLSTEAIEILCSEITPTIERLNLAGCRELLKDDHLDILLLQTENLREIDISDSTSVSPSFIETLVSVCLRLEQLSTSRCYGITPTAYLMLAACPTMLVLNVFGLMKDAAIKELKLRLPSIEINKYMFTTIARPTVGIRRSSIWNLRVRD